MMRRSLPLLLLLLLDAAIATARPKVGLVLGGGGAKGAAEIGVLKIIERYNIPIDYIAGTSIGALLGSLYAAGYNATELEQLFCSHSVFGLLTDRREDLRKKPFYRDQSLDMNYIFGIPAFNFSQGCIGMLRCDSVEHMVDSLLVRKGCGTFRQLAARTPFKCVASEFHVFNDSIKEIVLDTGRVAESVHASIAIPLFIKHQEFNDQHYVDGGMTNNLPIDVVRDMGAEVVIVIDLQQKKPEANHVKFDILDLIDLKNFLVDTWKNVVLGGAREVLKLIFKKEGVIAWALHRPDNRKYLDNLQLYQGRCLLYINPDLGGYNVASFGQHALHEMVGKGEQAALEKDAQLTLMAQHLNTSPTTPRQAIGHFLHTLWQGLPFTQ